MTVPRVSISLIRLGFSGAKYLKCSKCTKEVVYLEGGATASVGTIRVGPTGQKKFGHRFVTFLSGCKQKTNTRNMRWRLIDPAEEDPTKIDPSTRAECVHFRVNKTTTVCFRVSKFGQPLVPESGPSTTPVGSLYDGLVERYNFSKMALLFRPINASGGYPRITTNKTQTVCLVVSKLEG